MALSKGWFNPNKSPLVTIEDYKSIINIIYIKIIIVSGTVYFVPKELHNVQFLFFEGPTPGSKDQTSIRLVVIINYHYYQSNFFRKTMSSHFLPRSLVLCPFIIHCAFFSQIFFFFFWFKPQEIGHLLDFVVFLTWRQFTFTILPPTVYPKI